MDETKDKDLEQNYEGLNKYEVIDELYKRGYTKEEAVAKLKKVRLPDEIWKGTVWGAALIAVGILFIVFTRGTTSGFRFELQSSGDVRRLNEWIFKPFIALNLLLLGILLLTNKERFPFKLKPFYYIVLGLHAFLGLFNNSVVELLLSGAAIISIVYIKERSQEIITKANLKPEELEGNMIDKVFYLSSQHLIIPDIENVVLFRSWKGNNLFVLFILALICFFSTNINATNYNPQLLPYVNLLSIVMFLSTFTFGVLLAVNEKIITQGIYIGLLLFYCFSLVALCIMYGFQGIEIILGILILIVFLMYYQVRSVKMKTESTA